MDRVRFGRALGFGARQAVKTLTTAVDAATAEDPRTKKTPSGTVGTRVKTPSQVQPAETARRDAIEIEGGLRTRAQGAAAGAGPAGKAGRRVARGAVQGRELKKGLTRGGKRFGEAVWRPFVRLSGVLWLEVAGVFFGVVALTAVPWIWRDRREWRTGAPGHGHLLLGVGVLVVFGYFCVSSFVRAWRRERRR